MDTSWWKQNWHSPTITSNNTQQKNLITWLLFCISLGICGYLLFERKNELIAQYQSHNYKGMLILLTLLIPIVLLSIAIKKARQNLALGDTLLTMEPFPAVVGNAFLARIDNIKKAEKQEFFAELILHTHTKNQRAIANGKKEADATHTKTWCMPVTVNKQSTPSGTHLSLEARLPDNAPASSPSEYDEYYEWQLLVYSQDKGFKSTWNVPIVGAQQA